MNSNNNFEIKRFDFDNTLLGSFYDNHYVNGLWPLVYILSDGKIKEAYVGETTDAFSRISTHLKNNNKNKLSKVHLITSDKFNKSATLDIESNLIKYMAGDGQYKLLNGNLGLANHTYYQKSEVYWDIFKTIWSELKSEGITTKTLKQIDNSDLYKYSPYKSLSIEQKASMIDIIKSLLDKQKKNIIIEGGAGTGKTILAIFLFKLLNSANEELSYKEFGDDEVEFIKLIEKLKVLYPNPTMALVVPMASFRGTLKKVFQNIKGLKASMVVGPAEISNRKYDLLIVDESHRLRKRVNLGAYFGAFDKANERLGLQKLKGNELDWILMQGGKNLLFYDESQSIKPSDVEKNDFDQVKARTNTTIKMLTSQFRVRGGNNYVAYVDHLLKVKFKTNQPVFESKKYEFFLFDSLSEMIEIIKEKNAEFGLSRLIAGYSWEWVSKNKNIHDIVIDSIKLKWNSVSSDWVNSKNAINEVGCIHTTQGYDLNYTGLIFGNEISYDKKKNEIVIKGENYFDKNGKQSIKDPEELKEYIINIYKTMMLRGIRGTYIYVCDKNLRLYFEEHIAKFEQEKTIRILPFSEVKEYVNSVPFYDIRVAAGAFSDSQQGSEFDWIELPKPYKPSKEYFVCKVTGASMNKVIPDGSWCLFKKDPGGSREGKIVLVEHYDIQDPEYCTGYTIKTYESKKEIHEEGWSHKKIILKPNSYNPDYKAIELYGDELSNLKIVGVFVAVL